MSDRLPRSVTRRGLFAALGSSIFVTTLAARAHARAEPGATALEARLFAPCCWNGTLDVHDSELARELRKEIELRLARGETSETIQADFVARYGERIIAARSEAPIRAMGLTLVGVMALAGAGLGVVLHRWVRTRSVTDAPPVPTKEKPRDALDDRLDDALAEIE